MISKRISIWLNPELYKELEEFMKRASTQEQRNLYGWAPLAKSMTKAARYAIGAFLDKRTYRVIGIFFRCIGEIRDLNEELRESGQQLNDVVKSLASGNVKKINYTKMLLNLRKLAETNNEILDEFENSYIVDPTEK